MIFTSQIYRRINRLKLRQKLSISYTLTFTLLAGLTFIAIYFFAEQNREEEFFQRLKDKSITTFSILLKVEQIDQDMLKLFDRNTINSLYEEKTLIFDSTGKMMYSSIDDTRIFYPANILQKLKNETNEIEMNEGDAQVVALRFEHQGSSYYVITKAFDRFGKSKLRFLFWLLWCSFGVVRVLSFVLSAALSMAITKPVTELTTQIEGISASDLSIRVKVRETEDEISFLAGKFNRLLERVEDAFKFQYHFAHHVSHELKTPLSVMVSNAEQALSGGDEQHLRQSLQFHMNGLMDISNMIDAMLDICKTESKQPVALTELIRVDELLFECIEELRFNNTETHFLFSIDKSVESSESITVPGNIRMLKMAIINLLKNALNFSFSQNPVVQLSTAGDTVNIHIVNDGATIDTDEQKHLFNHLFRGKNSSQKKGFGLGLVLARRIIDLHHGTIHYSHHS